MHDARIGRFFAVDPLAQKYPYYTPYQFSGNKVIHCVELEGLEEYESYKAYQVNGGTKKESDLDGSDGVWFTADREAKNERWSNAMKYITEQGNADLLKTSYGVGRYFVIAGAYVEYSTSNSNSPFARVRDYYLWAQSEMDGLGYSSRWAMGASYLVDDLAFYSSVTSSVAPDLHKLLVQLNIGIANFAVGKFKSVLIDGKVVGDWYKWDLEFIQDEQGIVAYPIYDGAYKDNISGLRALNLMGGLNIGSIMERLYPGIGGYMTDIVKKPIPAFSLFSKMMNTDLTNRSERFGQEVRINVPMLMLYGDQHVKNWQWGNLNETQQKAVNKSMKEINSWYGKNKIK